MAYTVESGAILEVTIRARQLDQRVLSIFHYRYETTAGPADGPTVINAANTKLNTPDVTSLLGAWAKAVQNEVGIEEMVYQWLWPVRRARAVKAPARTQGLRVGDAAPSNISVFIEKLTEVAGRKGHGGLHMPGLTTDAYAGNEITLGYLTDLNDLRARMKEVVVLEFGQQLTPVVFNRAAPATSIDVLDTVVKEGVRTAHSRTKGVGE